MLSNIHAVVEVMWGLLVPLQLDEWGHCTEVAQLVKLLLVMLQLGLKLVQYTALMCKYLPTKCGRFMI